jgi:hypothetical protein
MERWAVAQVYRLDSDTNKNKSSFARALANFNKKTIKAGNPARRGSGSPDAKAMRKYLDRALREFKP